MGRRPGKGLPKVLSAAIVLALGLGLVAGSLLVARRGDGPAADARLTGAVQAAIAKRSASLGLDPRTAVFDVMAQVSGRTATLEGAVSRPDLRQAYEAAARGVRGVRRVVDRLVVLPDPALGRGIYGLVVTAVADLGAAPGRSTGGDRVTQALLGTVVEVLQERDGWYRVRMPDRYLGWIAGRDVVRIDAAAARAWREGAGARAMVVAKETKVLAAPRETAKALVAATMGTVLPVASAGGGSGFVAVTVPSGATAAGYVTGYLPARAVRVYPSAAALAAARGDAAGVIAVAKQFLGLPYLWGGTSARGFDCSGLTQFAFGIHGYALPRDADQQFASGTPVPDRSQLKPGDLVFFSTYKPGPSHVGIYIGGGRFIHAGSDGVAINSFDREDPDYSASLDQRYLGARRVLTDE